MSNLAPKPWLRDPSRSYYRIPDAGWPPLRTDSPCPGFGLNRCPQMLLFARFFQVLHAENDGTSCFLHMNYVGLYPKRNGIAFWWLNPQDMNGKINQTWRFRWLGFCAVGWTSTTASWIGPIWPYVLPGNQRSIWRHCPFISIKIDEFPISMLIYGGISMAIGPFYYQLQLKSMATWQERAELARETVCWPCMANGQGTPGSRSCYPWQTLASRHLRLPWYWHACYVPLLSDSLKYIRWTFMVSSLKKAPKKSMDVWCWSSHRFFGTAIRTGCVLCAGSFGSIFVASDSQVSQVDAPLLLTRHHELPPQSALVLPS